MAPGHGRGNRLSWPLEQGLHPAILAVAHPARETEALRFSLGAGAERNALHPPRDEHTNRHRIFMPHGG